MPIDGSGDDSISIQGTQNYKFSDADAGVDTPVDAEETGADTDEREAEDEIVGEQQDSIDEEDNEAPSEQPPLDSSEDETDDTAEITEFSAGIAPESLPQAISMGTIKNFSH
ncbi:MAG: hypothetical protein SGPRY_003484 [Prymnesium sp.]